MNSTDTITHHWIRNGLQFTFTWLGEMDVTLKRIYALAFTSEGKMLLVAIDPDDEGYLLPGGGIEPGESAEDALHRELLEEAAATITTMQRLGVQRVDFPNDESEYHAFYWCRVTLADEFTHKFEVTERILIDPADFLDTLFWGRQDPKAALLLERALQLEFSYRKVKSAD